jgi:hypothetical protein
MSVLDQIAEIEDKFQSQPIPKGPIKAGIIPGIGPKAIEKLKEVKCETVQQLVGMYLLHNCDNKLFQEWLQLRNISTFDSMLCITNIKIKLNSLFS